MLIYGLGMLGCWVLVTVSACCWCHKHGFSRAARPYALGIWLLLTVICVLAYGSWGAAPALRETMALQHRVLSVQQQWQKDGGASVIAQLQQHVAQHPEAHEAWYLLARLQWRRGALASAREAIEYALRLSPGQPKYELFKQQLYDHAPPVSR